MGRRSIRHVFRSRAGLGPFCSGLGPDTHRQVPGPGRLAERFRTLLNIEIIVLVIKLSMFKLMKSMDFGATASDYIWVDLHAAFHN